MLFFKISYQAICVQELVEVRTHQAASWFTHQVKLPPTVLSAKIYRASQSILHHFQNDSPGQRLFGCRFDGVIGAGKATSFTANSGQRKDMKQKTFELLQLAEDAEDEYEDEYDDGFDALNFVKGGRDVRMEADSTEPGAALYATCAALLVCCSFALSQAQGSAIWHVLHPPCPQTWYQMCRQASCHPRSRDTAP